MPRDNIVLAMSDDHAQWGVGAYGNEHVETPTLDYLAETGVRMENAFCPTPVCSPARASFFTGRRASQHGIHDFIEVQSDYWDDGWLDDEITLPELLSDNGYTTAIVGKWHCGRGSREEVFDYSVSMWEEGWDIDTFSFERDRRIANEAINFLQSQSDGEEPFFLFIGFANTHTPLQNVPERLVSRYRTDSFDELPDDENYRYGRYTSTRSGQNRQEARAQYYAAIRGVDEQMGRIVDELQSLGLYDHTLLGYTADHGYNLGQHGVWGKGNGTVPQNVLEESIRVPLIFSGHDDIKTGQTRTEFVDHCDTFQTVLAFADIEPPADVTYPGNSYLSQLILGDHSIDRNQQQVCEYADVQMIRDDRHKLIRQVSEGREILFDLKADPRETENRIEWPGYGEIADNLRQTLLDNFERYSEEGKQGSALERLPTFNSDQAWER